LRSSCYDGEMKTSAEPSLVRDLLPSALLGAASGMRSTVGLAAVVAEGDPDGLPEVLRHRLAKPAAAVAVAAELVLDKMPFTGSRLEPAGMAGRLVFAGAAAGLAASRSARNVAAATLVAAASAAVTAKVSHDLRARLARTAPDWVVAIVEDLVALTVAAAGCRRSTLGAAAT
jgi:hypothetical protein